MRWLCICEGGVNRSGGMAFALKHAGQDAIAASWKWNSPETLKHLMEWADYVVCMQQVFVEKLPDADTEAFRSKIRIVEVGLDTYGSPLNMELQQFCQSVVASWAQRDFLI